MLANNEQEIERLERLLNLYKSDKEQLEQQVKAKDELIQTLNKQNAILQTAKNNFASPKLYMHENSEALQQKINRLQKVLEEQAFQSYYLDQSISSLMVQIQSLQRSNQSYLSLVNEKDGLISNLRLRIQELDKNNKILLQQIELLNKNKQNYLTEKQRIKEEKRKLAQKIKQDENQKHNKIKMLFEGLNGLTKEMTQKKQDKKQKAEGQSLNDKLILKMQQEELQQRNEEIFRIRNILDGMQVPIEEQHLRTIIKHLRAELAKHNQRITTVLQKQQNAQELIKKYTETIAKYQKEIQDIANLKSENTLLKNKINELQFELKQMFEKQQSDKNLRIENKILMTELLKENQCFHQMMYENYGSNYAFYIENHKREYLKRLEQRAKREKWASVDELIEVNQKLRQKLKLI